MKRLSLFDCPIGVLLPAKGSDALWFNLISRARRYQRPSSNPVYWTQC